MCLRHTDRVNAIVTGLVPAIPREPFVAATAEVNEWRGRCLDAFTRGEGAVTECLAVLGNVAGRGLKFKTILLVGQRLDALALAIGPGGVFESEAGKSLAMLNEYRSHADVRNILCHGTSTVTLDTKGQWTVILRLAVLRGGTIVRESLALSQPEAEELHGKILAASRSLSSHLGQVRARLRQ